MYFTDEEGPLVEMTLEVKVHLERALGYNDYEPTEEELEHIRSEKFADLVRWTLLERIKKFAIVGTHSKGRERCPMEVWVNTEAREVLVDGTEDPPRE